ncbi:hypothetical protein ANN_15153 [Periplaneta americana]|uniref:Per a allergen n=1 Tax=Periplaneta americana TaxID=6978 RepID=A0ABQ8SFJ8_PERAM|nr:hypothetical protein ANN_15153 [Periplaneta americana]
MNPEANTESYPAFAHIGLRENPGENLNQVTFYEQYWAEKEQAFSEKWNFPHCVGAMDGKDVVLQSPLKSGIREGPRPTSRLLASRPHAEAEVDDHPTRIECTKDSTWSTILHNFLRRNSASRAIYSSPGSFDFEDTDTCIIVPGTWRNEGEVEGLHLLRRVPRKNTLSAKEVREEFAEFFKSEQGMVPWQNNRS